MKRESGKRAINMLDGPVWNRVLQFAVPLMATGILQQLFNAADIAVVGRFTGEQGAAAMAAVGACSPLIGLLLNAFLGISLGTNVVIANAVGRREDQAVSKAVHTSILLALTGGILLLALGEAGAGVILASQNVPADVMPMAILYFRIYMLGMPVILLYNFESAIFRGVGNTRTPLIALSISGVLNVCLNLLFVAVFHMTVDGVAIATVISNLVSSAILFRFLLKADSAIRVKIRLLHFNVPVLKRILRIGVPAGLQSAVFSFSNIIIQSAINTLGTVVMAASSAAFNIEIFAYYVLNSFSQACTTFVGQNYGAGKIDRCKRILWICLLEGAIATAAAVGVILLFGHSLLAVFNTDPEVIRIGFFRLVVIFATFIFTLSYETMSGYMRGFGISLLPAFLTTLGICGVRISWILLAFPADPTFENIMKAYPASLCATTILIFIALLVKKPAVRVRSGEKAESLNHPTDVYIEDQQN